MAPDIRRAPTGPRWRETRRGVCVAPSRGRRPSTRESRAKLAAARHRSAGSKGFPWCAATIALVRVDWSCSEPTVRICPSLSDVSGRQTPVSTPCTPLASRILNNRPRMRTGGRAPGDRTPYASVLPCESGWIRRSSRARLTSCVRSRRRRALPGLASRQQSHALRQQGHASRQQGHASRQQGHAAPSHVQHALRRRAHGPSRPHEDASADRDHGIANRRVALAWLRHAKAERKARVRDLIGPARASFLRRTTGRPSQTNVRLARRISIAPARRQRCTQTLIQKGDR